MRSLPACVLAAAAVIGFWTTSITGYRQRPSPYMIECAEDLESSTASWASIGRFLEAIAEPDDLIAVGPAGAIPYYSELPTVDMLGLTDAWVARYGAFSSMAAGHQRVATPEYLRQRNVTWLIAQPDVRDSPHPSSDKISLRMKQGRYLVVGTTLNADSLRQVLVGRNLAAPAASSEALAERGRYAAGVVIQGWRLAAAGNIEDARALSERALESSRDLGEDWRWVVREAGLLRAMTSRGEATAREEKRWREIKNPVPPEWRAALNEVRPPDHLRLDTTRDSP